MAKQLFAVTGRFHGDDDDTTYLVWVYDGEKAEDNFKERLASDTGKEPTNDRPVYVGSSQLIGTVGKNVGGNLPNFVLEPELDRQMREWPEGATLKLKGIGAFAEFGHGGKPMIGWGKRDRTGKIVSLVGRELAADRWEVEEDRSKELSGAASSDEGSASGPCEAPS